MIWKKKNIKKKKQYPHPKQPDYGGVGVRPRVWAAKSIYTILKEGSQLVRSHGTAGVKNFLAREQWIQLHLPQTGTRLLENNWRKTSEKLERSDTVSLPASFRRCLCFFFLHWKLGACVSAGILCLSSKASRNEQLERVGKITPFFLYFPSPSLTSFPHF